MTLRTTAAFVGGLLLLSACASPRSSTSSPDRDTPGGNPMAADPTGEAEGDMLAVLEQLQMLGGKPIETLSPQEARRQPTPADAVMALLRARTMSTTPEAVGSVQDRTIDAPGVPPLLVRVYTPAGTAPSGGWPVVVYTHGGGWVIATNDTYDSSGRALTNAAQAIVMSVEYRKGPEHKFPAAHDDAYAAYRWALDNAATVGGDPMKVAVAGESAGGNMAFVTSARAMEEGVRLPVHQLLVYPVASNDLNAGSVMENANAKPLNRPMLAWFLGHYLANANQSSDPRINLVGRSSFAGFPPTTIITAEIDPLLDGGDMLADRLDDADVDVERYHFDDVTHEFFGMGAVVPQAREAVARSGARLRASFGL